MDLPTLTSFFMWCTIINGGLLIYSSVFLLCAPDLVYRIQSRWFPISRKSFDVVIYSFLGLFKILFFFFSLTPWLALLIIGCGLAYVWIKTWWELDIADETQKQGITPELSHRSKYSAY